jgi:geranylgeranyl pyrophosphate synthase
LSGIIFNNSIHLQLNQVEERMRLRKNGYLPDLGSAIDHLLSSGGKRIRPAVSLLIGGMLGAQSNRLVTLGAAIELLHTATLVHDDLIDGALLRRGIATLNAKWSPAATVLTGDFIFAEAARLASETESIVLMHRFAETLAIIVNGELTQLFNSKGITREDKYLERIYAKTASLFELAAEAAAFLSPVGSDVISRMRQFGYDIGMAFQIMDDILDFTGEEKTIGKPVAHDLRQGLLTLPVLVFMKSNQSNRDMNMLLDDHNDIRIDYESLIDSIRASGAIEKARNEANHYIDSALEILSKQPACDERAGLEDLAHYIIRRSL